MILLAATMGLRRTEIATLHPHDRSDRILRVLGKNQAVREITLDDLTHQYLLKLEESQGQDDYYFPGRYGGSVHPQTVYKWVKHVLGRDWTLHSCRRRAATEGFRATKDIYALQRFLGHASLETTLYYVDTRAEDIAAIANAASLVHSKSYQRIAGSAGPTVEQLDVKSDFMKDLANLTEKARGYGMELRLR